MFGFLLLSFAPWIIAAFILGLALGFLRWVLGLYYLKKTHSIEHAPPMPVAIVFGAGLRKDGTPTNVLADRITTGVELFQIGKVNSLLMSGSPKRYDLNEANAMQSHAIQLGVPQDAIQLDHGGSRTFNTCFRARHIFGFDQALLVSQRFHLPRALLLAEAVGLRVEGVSADARKYPSQWQWNLREVPAVVRALFDAVHIRLRRTRIRIDKGTL